MADILHSVCDSNNVEVCIRANARQGRVKLSVGKYLIHGLIAFLLCVSSSPSSAQAGSVADGARVHVEALLHEGTRALANADATSQDLVDRFRQLFRDYFAVGPIAKWVLGRHWNNATSEQRQRYVRLFEDYIVLGLVKRFEHYTGGRVQVVDARVNNERLTTVSSKIVRDRDGSPVEVDWRVWHGKGTYKIADVSVQGTSMSQTLRSDFGAAVRSRGGSVDGFLEDLRGKIAFLRSELRIKGREPLTELANTN